MRELQVDFNNVVGSGVLPVPTHGQRFAVGERLRVFDEGTDMYQAVVVGVDRDTAFIEVFSDPLAT